MKFLPQCPGIRAALLLGFLAMAAIGWKAAGRSPAPSDPETVANATKSSERPVRPPSRFTVPSEARARVAALRAIRSPEERMRATIQMANTIPISEIGGWLEGRWFELSEGYDLTLFNKITKERWRAEDPEGLVRWYLRDASGSAAPILAEMAQSDPGRLLDFFQEHRDPSLALQTFTQLAKTNPGLALLGLKQVSSRGFRRHGMESHYTRQLLMELAKNSPDSLEAALDSLPLSVRNSAEAALIGEKLSASFSSGIRELWDRPDGWKIFQEILNHDRKVGANLFGELANLPPEWRSQIAGNSHSFIDDSNILKWLDADLAGMGFSETDSKNIQRNALSRLAGSQPEETLKRLAGSGLSGNERLNVIGNLFGNLGGNPVKAEALLASLATEEERAYARQHISSSEQTSAIPAIEKPEEWLETVGSSGERDNYQLLSVLRNWDKEKMTELGTRFHTMPDDEKSKVAKVLTNDSGHLNNMDPSLKGAAIQHLIAHPPEVPEGQSSSNMMTQFIAQSSSHAVNWAKSDPAAASAWVQSLPNGDAKIWAQKNLAANWALYDPQEAGQWVNSLPADARNEVREFMKNPDGQ